MNWDHAFAQEGARWREAALRQVDTERLLRGTMRRLQRDGLSPTEALALMAHLLEPLCGKHAAQSTMTAASRRCGGLSARNWRTFVVCLSELISSFCGAAAGRLVDQAGLSLELA